MHFLKQKLNIEQSCIDDNKLNTDNTDEDTNEEKS